eukprot:jgi/Bigna1/138955/aug1.47_g13663
MHSFALEDTSYLLEFASMWVVQGNIWTHLLGTLFFTYCLWEEILGFRKIPKNLEDEIDHFWLLLYLGSAAGCMLVSSAYHLFLCHSKSVRYAWDHIASVLPLSPWILLWVLLPSSSPKVRKRTYNVSIWGA